MQEENPLPPSLEAGNPSNTEKWFLFQREGQGGDRFFPVIWQTLVTPILPRLRSWGTMGKPWDEQPSETP